MRPIGFSTGAIAHADFRLALEILGGAALEAVELSALRPEELVPLLDALDSLDLSRYDYVSLHAPSRMDPQFESFTAHRLLEQAWRAWPVVVHPDAISDMALWRRFGPLLCIENMDKRKPIGRTAGELREVFRQLPDASLCFDIGHARQCDPTMTEAYLILREFGGRLRQVHVSEVNTASRHDVLSFTSIMAFRDVADMIPEHTPLILETPVGASAIGREIDRARRALPIPVGVSA